MNILLVTAHQDAQSFVASLQNAALGVLERKGHTVVLTELYDLQFNPVASMLDFKTNSGAHVDYMFEQQRAVNTGSGFSLDIEAEMEKVKNADLLIFHFPLWFYGPPAIMKGWIDRILAMAFAWNTDARYQTGLMRGKKALVTTTIGDPESFYSADGMHGATVEQHLYGLLHTTFAFCGFDVLHPFIIDNTTAEDSEILEKRVSDYRDYLQNIENADNYIYKHPSA